jgi:hypothetical protein
LWEHKETLDKLGVSLLILTFEPRKLAETYQQESVTPWPLLIDESRHLYHQYNMFRAGFWDIWGPRTWWAYIKELLNGNIPTLSSGDTHQRGGDVLINGKGIVQLHHVGAGPADRPSVESILRIVRKNPTVKGSGRK